MSGSRPPRPAIPVTAWCAAALYGGIVLAERISWRFAVGDAGVPPATIALASLLAALVLAISVLALTGRGGSLPTGRPLPGATGGAKRGAPVTLAVTLILCASLGLGLGSARWHGWHAARAEFGRDQARPGHGRVLSGVVVRDPFPGRFGWTVILKPRDAHRVRIRVMMADGEGRIPRLGETVTVFERPGPVPLDEEWSRRAHQRIEAGSVRARAPALEGWSRTPTGLTGPLRTLVTGRLEKVPGVGGDLLQGILLGDRTRLRDTPAEEDLRVCGLSHLMAVSGTHLGIVALVATQLVAHARRGVRTRVLVVACVTLLYVILSGVQSSALRALGMGTVAGVAALSGRRGDGVSALAVASAGMMVADPAVVFDVGFRLSVCAVAGLVLFAPLATCWARAALGEGAAARRLRPIAEMLAITLVAQAATAPVAIPVFGMFSLIAPAANAIALPLLTLALAMGLGATVAGLLFEPVAVPLLAIASVPLRAIARVASALAAVPGAVVGLDVGPGALAGMAFVLVSVVWVGWPLPRGTRVPRLVAAALLVATLGGMTGVGPPASEPLLTVLDVGQGDAVLVRDGGRTVLIDTGPDPARLRSALTRERVRHIDALVLTHDHADHTGGVEGMIGVARVRQAFGPVLAEEQPFATAAPALGRLLADPAQADGPVSPLRAGDVLVVGPTRLEVLWPRAPDPGLSANDTSVVMHLTRGSFSALLAGDAEEAVWSALGRDGAVPDVDVALVPHHGSANGMTAEALEGWSPSLALISVGERNDFGHPAAATLDMLAGNGVTVARTDTHGDLAVYVRDTGEFSLRVRERGGGPVACATIPQSVVSPLEGPGAYGRITARGPQARLSDTRIRRPAPRAGRGPPQEALVIRGGSRLQPRPVRRRAGRGR